MGFLVPVFLASGCDSKGDPEGGGTDNSVDAGGKSSVDSPAGSCGGESSHSGDGTYYDADGSGNCSFDATPQDLMVGAMNQTDYVGSGVCGACAHLTGPNGEVTVRIVDRCPECKPGDIDLSREAFSKIAPLASGRVKIAWKYVPCAVTGPLLYRFKEGSNQWWTAVQIRNHRHAIKSLEVLKKGAFVAVTRENYNYFVDPSGMGPGPYTFRITDVYGHVLNDTGIAHVEGGEVSGAAQFPSCSN